MFTPDNSVINYTLFLLEKMKHTKKFMSHEELSGEAYDDFDEYISAIRTQINHYLKYHPIYKN